MTTTTTTTTTPKIVSLQEIEAITSRPEFHDKLVQGIADGFVKLERGNFFAPPIQTLGAPPFAPFVADCGDDNRYAGQACVKSGYFKDNPYYVIKVAAGGHPLPNSGCMQIYSQTTGRFMALLLDQGILTELRTAAVSALVFKLWMGQTQRSCSSSSRSSSRSSSNNRIAKIGMLGTGIQARYQMDAIGRETPCRHLVVHGRTPAKVQAYQTEMQAKGWTVDIVADPNDLLQQCDVVITTTSARSAVLHTTTAATTFVTRLLLCIGSDAPGKTEVAKEVLKKASLLIADNAKQSRQRGEYQGWIKDDIVNLGDWIQQPGQGVGNGLVVFDSSGVAVQDCVIAQLVYECLL